MLCYLNPLTACADIDPFDTNSLTTINPQTYWTTPLDFTVSTSSQQSALRELPRQALSLTAVTDFALRNNPATRLAWSQAKAAAAQVGIAKSAYLPQVNVGASVDYSADIFSSNDSSETTFGPNISLSYMLLDFGNRANTVKAAQYNLIAANLNQNSAIQQVILQVQEAYYQVLGQQALVAANRQTVVEAKASLASAQALRANGMATIGDVYQAEGSLAQANLNLQTSQGNYQTALGQLATSMGLPANAPLKLMSLTSPPALKKIDQAMTTLLAVAERNRPDLLAAEAQVRASSAQLAATKASVLPTLTITSSVLPGGTFNNTNGTSTDSLLTLSFPLFTGFSYTYNVKNAQAALLTAQATRDQLNQQVQFQVWQAYYALQTAALTINTTDILLKSSTQASKQAIGQYKGGVGDILTVLTTQTTLANARVESIQAKLNWYIALAQLAQAMGTLKNSLPRDLP